MIALERADVEIDHCTACGGIWLDAGELKLLLGNSEQAEQLLDSFKIDPQVHRKEKKVPYMPEKNAKNYSWPVHACPTHRQMRQRRWPMV